MKNKQQIVNDEFLSLLSRSGVYLLNNVTGKASTVNVEDDEIQFFESCAPGPMSDPEQELHDVNDAGLGHVIDIPEFFDVTPRGSIMIDLPKKIKKTWAVETIPHTLLVEVSLDELKALLAMRSSVLK